MSEHAISNAKAWLSSIVEMVAEMNAAQEAEEWDAHDEKREEIQDSSLSVQVRGGWYSPGDPERGGAPEEFEILLSTGGPALRVVGGLDHIGQPTDCRLQWQDWGTPWTDHFDDMEGADEALEAFCAVFYFGEGQ